VPSRGGGGEGGDIGDCSGGGDEDRDRAARTSADHCVGDRTADGALLGGGERGGGEWSACCCAPVMMSVTRAPLRHHRATSSATQLLCCCGMSVGTRREAPPAWSLLLALSLELSAGLGPRGRLVLNTGECSALSRVASSGGGPLNHASNRRSTQTIWCYQRFATIPR
jgi:hypothetical protein